LIAVEAPEAVGEPAGGDQPATSTQTAEEADR
jgi:hypothetical protein